MLGFAGDEFGDEFGDKFGNSFGTKDGKIGTSLGNSFESSLGTSFWSSVGTSFGNSLRSSLDFGIGGSGRQALTIIRRALRPRGVCNNLFNHSIQQSFFVSM